MGQRGDCHGGREGEHHTYTHPQPQDTHSVAQTPSAEPGEYHQADTYRSQAGIGAQPHEARGDPDTHRHAIPPGACNFPIPGRGAPPNTRAQAHTRAHTDLGEG